MDTIQGETYNILSPDLIEDESSTQHQIKTWTNNVEKRIQTYQVLPPPREY